VAFCLLNALTYLINTHISGGVLKWQRNVGYPEILKNSLNIINNAQDNDTFPCLAGATVLLSAQNIFTGVISV